MRRSDSSELSKLRQVPPHLLLSNAQATTRHHCCHQPVAKLHWSLKLPRVSLSLLCFTTNPLSKQIHRPNFLPHKQVNRSWSKSRGTVPAKVFWPPLSNPASTGCSDHLAPRWGHGWRSVRALESDRPVQRCAMLSISMTLHSKSKVS